MLLSILFITIMSQTNARTTQQQIISETAKVNGTSIYYESTGKGFPIVFISGGGSLDRRGWDNQFETFAKYHRVIRYDLRGIGKSSRPQAEFSHAQDLYSLLGLLKIKRAHVIGLSVGAAIAIDFAIAYPEMVDHLILASPGLSSDSKSDQNLAGLQLLADLVKTKGIEYVIQLTLEAPFVLSKGNTSGQTKVREIYLDNKDVFEAGFPVFALWQPDCSDPESKLKSIKVPALIIRGDNDSPVYSMMTDKITKGIPHAKTVVLPGGTHFLNLEKPAEFNQAVLDFIKQ